ncbi:MAG: BlaI/MecI/CopY family transcriptional regulator [Bdellovibrionaceae bacterium]|nr:BlaI/MecI/CopY family transcriptional regulator [Pseudobdellovibrionaceae bacterium]
MKNMPSLGEQEIEVLKWISDAGKACVREVSAHFEKEKGLARTTVLTVMERLRKKGYLVRVKDDGLFFYSAKVETQNVLKSRVGYFVEKTLGGSISPLLSYFAENKNISEEELNKLQDILNSFEDKKGDL